MIYPLGFPLAIGAFAGCLHALKQVELKLRNHHGGAHVRNEKWLTRELSPYSIAVAGKNCLDEIVELADFTFQGTMSAGAGNNVKTRKVGRKNLYALLMDSFDAAIVKIEKDDELVGFTLVVPVNDQAGFRYMTGDLSYSSFDDSHIEKVNPQVYFIGVSLAIPEHISAIEDVGGDLVGQTLVRHIGYLLRKTNADFRNITLIASGVGWEGRQSFHNKGFVSHHNPDKDGHEIMIFRFPTGVNRNYQLFYRACCAASKFDEIQQGELHSDEN